MAIDTISPVADSQLDPGDSFSFRVDDTYTTITIEVETSGGWEYAYDSSLSGAQAGYTVSVTIPTAGRHQFTVTRSAGWDLSPFSIRVVENETGSSATTTTNYTLASSNDFPQNTDPYYLQYVSDSLLAHFDTPSTYSGQGSKFLAVKATEDGIEFATVTPGATTWGSITGTLSAQTDLQTALNAKKAKELDGAGAPGVSTGNGYELGQIYTDSSANTAYVLVDNTTDANVWQEIGAGGGVWGSITGTITAQTDLVNYVTDGTVARDALFMTERADHVNAPVAGKGEFWVKNDVPNTPMFTNDGSTDYQLARIQNASSVATRVPYMSGSTGELITDNTFEYHAGSDQLRINNLRLAERASGEAAAAGYGYLWVKSDTPNALIFKDDAGSDFRVLRQLDSETWQSTALLRAYGGEDGRVFVESNLRYNSGLGQLQMYDSNANIRMKEGTAPTSAASYGHIWVKNDAPNTAQFTDDASNTYELGDRVYRIWYPMRGANTTTSIYLRNPSWQPNTYQSWSTNGGSTQGSLAAPAFTYGFPVVPFDGYITRIFGSLRYWGTSGADSYITDCELWKWSGADEATAFSGSEVAGSGGYLEISDTTTGTSSSGIQIYNFDLTISSNNSVSKGDMLEAVFWNQTTNVSGYPHVSQIVEITRTNVPST